MGWQDDPIVKQTSATGSWQNDPIVDSPSGGESFARGAANNFPLVPQAIAGLGKGDYSKNLEEWNAKAKTAKETNPITYGAGAVAGAAAPAFIPGVGEALEASPVAGNAILGGLGAMSNTDVLKDPAEAAKQAAIGGTIGAGVGKITSMIPTKGAQTALEDKASDITAQGLNLPPKLLGNLEDSELTNYGRFAQEHDLLNPDVSLAHKNAEEALAKFGSQIGATGAKTAPLEESGPYIQALMEKAEAIKKLAAPGAAQEVATYERGAQDILENGKTFGDLQDLKSYYGPKAFDVSHQVKDQAMADVYGQIKKAMNDLISGSPKEYQEQLANYTMAHDAERGLRAKLGQVRSGSSKGPIGFMGRMIGKLPGQNNPLINLPTAVGVGAATHPLMGLMAASPTLTNPAVQSGVLRGAAKALPKLKGGLSQDIIDYVNQKRKGALP